MAERKYISFSNLSKFFDNFKSLFATKTEVDAKSDKTHTHSISDITNLQNTLNGKASTSHGTHVSYSTSAPLMDGAASTGSVSTVARSDHKHPTDTSRAAQTALDSHTGNTTAHITSTERTNWNKAYTHSQSAHAPSDAEPNQNAFSNVKIGDVTIAADIKTDTLTLVAGNNITLTPDATNDKITIAAKDTTYSLGSFGVTATAAELNKLDGVTASATELNYVDGVTSNIQNQLDGKAPSSHKHTVANISDLTATAKELNYMDGVTSNVQTQLDTLTTTVNGKANTSHTHNYAGSSSVGGDANNALKLQGYTRNNLYKDLHDWINAVGLTHTIVVEGDKDTYYPVRIYLPSAKTMPTYVSIHKNLGTQTPEIEGNHSNGTSSMWLIYEGRNRSWDGNGGYLKTWYRYMGYANLCAHTDIGSSAVGDLIVWLRGGGCLYQVSKTANTAEPSIYYEETNIGTEDYPYMVAPRTDLGNKGIYSATLGYGNIEGNATTATKATQDSNGNVIASTYETKANATSKLTEAKTYADNAANKVKNDLLNGAGSAYDTLKELGELIDDNVDAIEALEIVASSKANASDLTSHTSNKSNPHGVTMAQLGIGSAGSSLGLVKTGGDVTISSGVITVNDDSHNHTIANVDNLQTSLDAKQNTITGGATTITGSNLTANRALVSNGSGKVAVSAVTSTELGYLDGVTSNVQTQLDGKAASSHNHSASNITSGILSSDRLPVVPIEKGGTGATTASGALTNLGITATATELNYVDGVTSNIQTQLNNKAASNHTHSYLPLSGGNLTGVLGIGNKYELSPAYNYTNGCLINIGAAKSSTMVAIHITGNSYNSNTLPINSLFQFYDYGDGIIMNCSGVNLGLPLGAMTVYRYNNRLYAYIKQTGDYQTLSFTILTNKSGLSPTVENAAAHTSGYTNLVTITPKNVSFDGHTHNYAGSSSAGGAATSAIKATQDASGNVITSTYATKTELDTTKSNLQTSINGKANSSHTHTIANVTNLQSTLDGKSNTSHTHSYAGSSSVGGSATSAVKLDTSTAGDSNTPVYFSGGKPVACTSLDLNTSGSSASCTGNSATATKLQTARTIGLGTGATGTATSFNGTANITIPITDVKESYLSWGGKNISGGVTPIDAACSNVHSANRFIFAKPAGITIEYSTNGSTYSTYSTTDSAKVNLVSGIGSAYYIGARTSSTTVNDKLRITLNATNMGLYTRLRKLLINISTNYATGCNVIIERAMKGSESTYVTVGTYQISGWSGWNSIPINYAFGGGDNQTYNIANLRLTFGITGINSEQTSNALTITDIIGIGDIYWSYPSTMAKTGHLYSYDSSQNATFPAKVTATTFAGALSGNATTATKLATARTISLTGDVTGSASFDGSANASITATVADDSHNHIISNIDGLQTALNSKSDNDHRHYAANISVTGEDLNNYTDAGIYTFTNGSAPSNVPAGTNGWLIVIPWENGSTTIKQLWFRHGTVGSNDFETYVRTKVGSNAWGSWSKYYTTSNPPTYAEVGASPAFTNSAGGVEYSYGSGSGKNVLTEISNMPQGLHTVYAISGTTGNPKTTESFRYLIHKTSTTIGWILAWDAQGSLFTNYQSAAGTFKGWKCVYDAAPSALWTGGYYMSSTNGTPQTVKPSKKLSECRNGWVLVWSDYDADTSTKNNTDIHHDYVFKKNCAGANWSGQCMICDIPRYMGSNANDVDTERRILKAIYIHDDRIEGSYQGSYDERNDVILRAVYEF